MSMRYPGGLIATSPVNARYPSGVWTQAQAIPYQSQNVWTRDQFWPYTTLLLQGNGTNGAQNNTFLDSSSNNFTITRNGNTTQGSFTPYEQDGYWSNYLDGSSARLTIGTQAILNVGTGNFTIECFIFFPGRSSAQSRESIIAPTEATSSSGVNFRLTGSTQGSTGIAAIVAGTTVSSSTPISANTWHHVAAVRNSGTVTIYVDGVSVASGSASGSISNTASYNIGSLQAIDPAYNDFFQGYISNFRTTSTAVYTSAFTPNAAPLTAITNTSLLTCQSNRFKDNSTNNFTITVNGSPSVQAFQPFPGATTWSASVLGGSGYFDGSGDYLTAPDNAALEPGSSDLTWEMWINTTNSTQYATLYSRTTNIFATGMWSLMMNVASSTAGDVALYVGDYSTGSPLLQTAGVNVRDGAWHHIAVVRNGSAWALYVDGVSRATQTWSGTIADISGGPYIGRDQYYTRDYTGYISNLRVLKGTAAYTSAFTPPTVPVTAITNTSLLLNFTNAGIYDNSMMNNLETVGNAQVSTSVVKYGTGSMAFDGSGDWLVAPSRATTSLEGDFTIEGWAYLSSTAAAWPVITIGDSSGASGIELYRATSNGKWRVYSSNTARIDSNTSTGTGSWVHLAVVRLNGVVTLYVNGVSEGSTWSTTSTFSGAVYVGAEFNGGSVTVAANGYIDDLRITKAARYITNFTPPIARLPAQ